MNIKRQVKDLLFNYFVGPLAPGIDNRPRILGYHSIGRDASVISTPLARFRQHIEWLMENKFRLMTLREWWEASAADQSAPDRSVILTFDDGFKGILDHAAPVLNEFGIRGTVFIVTDYIGRTNAYDRALNTPEHPLLDWNEIEELKSLGWDIQLHGKQHVPVTLLDEEKLEDDLIQGKTLLEDRLGESIEFFCYPYGIFDEKAIRILKKTGFRAAVTCMAGTLSNLRNQDPFKLRRAMVDGLKNRRDFAFRFSPAYQRLSDLWFPFNRLVAE